VNPGLNRADGYAYDPRDFLHPIVEEVPKHQRRPLLKWKLSNQLPEAIVDLVGISDSLLERTLVTMFLAHQIDGRIHDDAM
jgi:hypothetical protein